MTRAFVYGKVGCKLCDAAKDKLRRLGVDHQFVDLMAPPENWRETGITGAMAIYQDQPEHEKKLPIIGLDGEFMTYTQAMKKMKGTQ
jgi:glutaredoxin